MKRVLVIAYFFPPLANSGTQRPTKFVKYLPECGWTPVVLAGRGTFDDKYDHTLSRELDPSLEVHRVPMLNEVLGDALARVLGERVGRAVDWRLRAALANPEIYGAWRRTARRAGLSLLRADRFDAILATGSPWTSLLVARDLSAETDVPFVADFRDVWTLDDIYAPHEITKQEWDFEQSVVHQASAVVSVSDTMTEAMRTLHRSERSGKFHTVLNGYDPQDISVLEAYPARADGKVRIVYAGVWKPTYGPHLLYNSIAGLSRDQPLAIRNLEVIAVGFPRGPASALGIERYVTELGPVSHPQALGVMATADALYAPLPLGLYHGLSLPGKLFEYLGIGRPVFSTAAADGETARLLARVGGGRVLPSEEPAMRDLLVEMCRAGGLQVAPIDDIELRSLTRRHQTRLLANILDRASET